MDSKKSSIKLLYISFITFSYLALVALLLVILYDQSRTWKLFIDHYIHPLILKFLLFASLAAAVGSYIYNKRHISPYFQTDAFCYVLLLIVATIGLCFKFHAMDLIILLYAVYSILFIKRSSEKTFLYKKSTLNFVDRLISALFHIESRTPALFALLLLIFLPLLIIFKKTSTAENIAVYVYYLLFITVVLQIIEMKSGIERENRLLIFLADTSRQIYAAFMNLGRLWKEPYAKGIILYLTVLTGILGCIFIAKFLYWKEIVRTLDVSPQHRSQISILKPDDGRITFPSDTDEIIVPIRIRHPLSKPLWWENYGGQEVKIGIMWFLENQAGRMELNEYEDYQLLPETLYLNDSIEMSLKLHRPIVQTGRTYEVWVGLVSYGQWWFSKWGDGVLKLRVDLERFTPGKDYVLEARMSKAIRGKMEQVWSRQLAVENNYRSTIGILKKDLLRKNNISVFVKNEGRIPWPIHNQTPVKLGVVWLQRLEEKGISRYIHLFEETHLLPGIITPGGKVEMDLSIDPFKVRDADEVWIGMVHEGKTWFYKRGDKALKLFGNINKSKIATQQAAFIGNEYIQESKELNKQRVPRSFDKTSDVESENYRSKIRLLNYKTDALLESKKDGLALELEITNTGRIPWKPDQPANEKSDRTNLGILWFVKAEEKANFTMRVAEQRCVFPFTILENVTTRMECKIGSEKLLPGNYEVWIGPVHEGVSWFYDKGDQVLKLNVTVP